MSRTVTLIRPPNGHPNVDGTFGRLYIEGVQKYVTGELPWRGNEPDLSCVPPGAYHCILVDSPKHGRVYELQNVPNRTYCQIHPANFCGDVTRGKKSELLGCIAFGHKTGELQPKPSEDGRQIYAPQMAVLESIVAVREFMTDLKGEDFYLEILIGNGGENV